MRRSYTPEQKAQLIAALAAGMTQRQVAAQFGVPVGSVAVFAAAAREVALMQDYRDVTQAHIRAAAEQSWRTLDVQLRLLGDRDYLTLHGGEVFSLASAYRVVAETLGRFLLAARMD